MTILNQEMIMITPSWITSLFIIFAISTGALFLIWIDIPDSPLPTILLTISLLFFFIFAVIIAAYKVPTGRSKYEVILDENYSVKNLYSNYKVIEQRGDIWVLEDK